MDSVILVSSHLLVLIIGAGIAVGCSYLFRSDGAGTGIAREQAARRLALLEEVALQTGQVHHLFQTYIGLLIEAARKQPGQTPSQQEELSTVEQQLHAALDDLPLADARLLLLNETTLGKVLRLYGSRITQLRHQQSGGKKDTEEELKNRLRDINSLRDKFFSSLSDRYGKKLY